MVSPLLAIHSHAELLAYDAAVLRSRGRPFYYGGSGTCLAFSALSAGAQSASMFDATAGGCQIKMALGVASATQTCADTTGVANGDTHYFCTANVTRTVQSFVANTSITYTATVTSTTNETVIKVNGDRKMAFGMIYNEVPRRVKGIGVLRTVNAPAGCSMDMNLSLWPNKINTNDWNPDATGLVDANAWGTVNIPNITGSVRSFIASFQASIVLQPGYYWVGNQYQFTTGNSGTGSGLAFLGCALTRLEAYINGATGGYSRYDQITTTAIAYAATTPTAALSGKAFVDQSAALTTRAEGIDYFLWCDPL